MSAIDFGLYLSEAEQREIAADEFRAAVRDALKTKSDVERFVGNVAYAAIEDIVDAAVASEGTTGREVIAAKTAHIIRNLTSYSVFREGGSHLNPRASVATQLLDEAVRENRAVIAKRVRRLLNEVGPDDLRYAITDVIADAFANLTTEATS